MKVIRGVISTSVAENDQLHLVFCQFTGGWPLDSPKIVLNVCAHLKQCSKKLHVTLHPPVCFGDERSLLH